MPSSCLFIVSKGRLTGAERLDEQIGERLSDQVLLPGSVCLPPGHTQLGDRLLELRPLCSRLRAHLPLSRKQEQAKTSP